MRAAWHRTCPKRTRSPGPRREPSATFERRPHLVQEPRPVGMEVVDRVRAVEIAQRTDRIPAHLEGEPAEPVPGLRILGLEVRRLDVELLRTVRLPARL